MKSTWRAAATIAAILAVSCTDPTRTTVGPEPIMTNSSTGGSHACDLTRAMTADVASWYPQPEHHTAKKTMRALSDACAAGKAELVTKYAIELLRSMEAVVDGARGGDALIGSRLANALLACTTSAGCTAAGLPGLDLTGAMTLSNGLFRLYTGAMGAPAVARGTVPFVDFSGRQNKGLFGVELNDDWSWTAANGGSPLVLVYGAPVVSDPLMLLEPGFGGLQYDVKRWPAAGPFVSDDIVHVAACFAFDVALPHDHDTGESSQPRLQREGTLLSTYSPTFCPPRDVPQQASLLGTLTALSRSVLPARLVAMFSDVRTPVIGGSALDFSRFAPVAASTSGRLEMSHEPVSVAKSGQSIGPVVIRAVSGGGTPMERVAVRLYVERNRGVPAGAVLIGETSGYTRESDGTVTLDGLTIPKPGGYIICARGELDGFSFAETCSSRFHVRK